jgi:hypothetical protein
MGLIDFEAPLKADLGMWEEAEALYGRLPKIREFIYLRNVGHVRYSRLIAAKIEAAYHFEEMSQYCRAFLIWAELARNSAGMFDAAPGLRRIARRLLREAIFNAGAFVGELRRFRKASARASSVFKGRAESIGQ